MTDTAPSLITGAAGFLGKHLISHLLERGEAVIAMSRRPCDDLDRLKKAYEGSLQLNRFDLVSGEGDLPEAGTVSAIICCAAVVLPTQKNYGINIEMARTQALIQRDLKIPKCIAISSQNVEFTRRGLYAQSKLLSERIFQTECSSCLHLIRPTLIYDEHGNSFLQRLVGIARRTGIVPQLGVRPAMLQPVYVGDLCEIIRQTLDVDKPETLSVYGGAELSLATIAKIIRRECKALSIVPIPVPILKFLSQASPATKDKFLELYENKVAAAGVTKAMEDLFGLKLRKFEEDLPDIVTTLLTSD